MGFSLESIVEFSNVLVVFLVLSCFFTMATYIIRLQDEPVYSSVVRVAQPVLRPQPMLLVHNPFIFKLCDPNNASLSGIKCLITTKVPCIWQAFWGVSVNDLHHALNFPWHMLKELMNDELLLPNSCVSRTRKKQLDVCNDCLLELTPESTLLPSDIGRSPRTKYPLALLLIQETELSDSDNLSAVVGMLNIVHIKDSFSEMETNILAQYLKQANGTICCLKPLYMVSSESPDSQDDEQQNCDNQRDMYCRDQLCVVCQVHCVTRALLPCRHACICASCFKHIDKCPLCRSSISSYFCIREEITELHPTVESVTSQEEQPVARTWYEHWEAINDRLNELLGFT